jgi:X-X-X-Leu-X-X-Gly heptad repeat protein
MASGLAEEVSGLAEVATGLAEVVSGLAEVARGLVEMASGFAEVAGGLAEVASGLAQVASGLADVAAKTCLRARPRPLLPTGQRDHRPLPIARQGRKIPEERGHRIGHWRESFPLSPQANLLLFAANLVLRPRPECICMP